MVSKKHYSPFFIFRRNMESWKHPGNSHCSFPQEGDPGHVRVDRRPGLSTPHHLCKITLKIKPFLKEMTPSPKQVHVQVKAFGCSYCFWVFTSLFIVNTGILNTDCHFCCCKCCKVFSLHGWDRSQFHDGVKRKRKSNPH